MDFSVLTSMKIVLSPARVPTTSFQFSVSIASAAAGAVPDNVLITIVFPA